MAAWGEHLLNGWFWREALLTTLVLVVAWLSAQIYLFLIDRMARRWAKRTASTLDDRMLATVRRPGFVLILLFGIYAAVHRYRFRLQSFLDGVLFALGVFIVIYSLIRLLGAALEWYADRLGRERPGETGVRELLPLAEKFLKIMLVVIGLLVVLDHFAIDIKSILLTLGVGSLAIGLALQDTLANMFGGFTIMLDRPFRVGDRIQLQTGELGDVQSIGLRSTNVLLLDGNLLIVPNSHLVKNVLTNHSYPDNRGRVMIELGVAYGTDPEKVKSIVLEVIREQPAVLEEPGPAVFFRAFGDFALKFLAVCHVRHFRDTLSTTDSINSKLNTRFRAESIEIPYPIQTVLLTPEASNPGQKQARQ